MRGAIKGGGSRALAGDAIPWVGSQKNQIPRALEGRRLRAESNTRVGMVGRGEWRWALTSDRREWIRSSATAILMEEIACRKVLWTKVCEKRNDLQIQIKTLWKYGLIRYNNRVSRA